MLAIVTSYTRPQNVPKIIDALKRQTAQDIEVIVVDNTAHGGTYPDDNFKGADDVWKFQKNLGCPCHFAPALCILGHRYTWFIDDDVVPGPRTAELLMAAASDLKDDFASIGFTGRLFKSTPGHRYDPRNQPLRRTSPVICDNTCRMHLVKSEFMEAVPLFRNKLLKQDYDEAIKLCSVHDDLLMCLSIQWHKCCPSYVIPLDIMDLDDKKGVWRRPTHVAERCRFVELALKVGWRQVTEETMRLE